MWTSAAHKLEPQGSYKHKKSRLKITGNYCHRLTKQMEYAIVDIFIGYIRIFYSLVAKNVDENYGNFVGARHAVPLHNWVVN